jgi:hypothetical protein
LEGAESERQLKKITQNKVLRTIFFGNYFYGFCAVALSFEAVLQQQVPSPDFFFYLMAFCATVLFYSRAYLVTEKGASPRHIRSAWYGRNRKAINRSQLILAVFLALLVLRFIFLHWQTLLNLSGSTYALLLLFPSIAILYYGIRWRGRTYQLRHIGWLKPLIIGLSWAGLVTVYPLLYQRISSGEQFTPGLTNVYFFLKNLMYITLLCILFDIKDYAMDYNQQLKTVVVRLGLRRTMFLIIIPLALLGFGAFLIYAVTRDFSIMRILVNSIPFASIVIATYAMTNLRSIFFYLMVIDGLMLVEALCGILGVLCF